MDQGGNWSGHDIVSTNRNHKKGWPADKNDSPLNIREYWPYRDELATENGLTYRGTCLIIPTKLRPEMVVRAHRSHLGNDAIPTKKPNLVLINKKKELPTDQRMKIKKKKYKWNLLNS